MKPAVDLKTCTKCGVAKSASEFHGCKLTKCGLRPSCKACASASKKAYVEANRDVVRERNARYAAANKDSIRVRQAAWHRANREHASAKSAEWYRRNKERAHARSIQWAKDHPEYRRALQAERYRRRKSDPSFVVRDRVARGVRHSLRGRKGGAAWEALVGYSTADLREHLERQFLKGMSWENMGEWHIDHIVPLSSFTITGPDDPELRRAWALSNLRPLWAKDNIRKSAKRVFLV